MKKEYRVRKNEEFGKIIARKQSFANRSFVVYYTNNNSKHMRVGISVSKKLGNAVVRNKIKRQVRMLVQQTFNVDDSKDYIVIVRNQYLQLTYNENKKELEYIYKKIVKKDGKVNGTRQKD